MIFKFVIIAFVSSVIASMGIGGGSIFILLSSLFNLFPYKEVKFYNLFMFIITGFIATIFNIKNKKVNLKEINYLTRLNLFGSASVRENITFKIHREQSDTLEKLPVLAI